MTIVEMSQEALDRGTGVMRKNYEASAAKGRMTAEQVEQAMGLLKPTLDFEALADCDLIIEAVFEQMEIKKEIFGRLDKIAKPGAILASNTSYLNVDEIAACTSRPQDVVGMHFFSPANVMKLLEVVRGAKTAPDVLVTAMQIAKKIKKVAVVAGVCHGFIGNRMLMPRQVEATKLLLEGATPEQIDRVHVEFGMPMGPFQMADLAGVDIGWHRDPNRIENIRDALCAIDRWGQKKGAGFYDYDDKRRPSPSPVVQKIIEDFAAKQGVERREISDQEIVERTLYTMVNEGAKILEEGMAQRASDIDVVWVYGYGWPVYRGGPMFWADTEGLAKIVEGLKRQEARMGNDFSFSQAAARQGREGREVRAYAYGRGLGDARRLRPPAAGSSIASATAATPALARKVAPRRRGPTAGRRRGWRAGGDAADEPEGAEAGRAQIGRARCRRSCRAKMPWVSAICAPHKATPSASPARPTGCARIEIAGDQHARCPPAGSPWG